MPERWQETDNYRLESAIQRVTSRQLRLITARQMLEAGLGERGISHRSQRRKIFRIHRGVYAVHPPPYSQEQRWLAAVLACGSDAFLCGPSAGNLQGICRIPTATAHVCSPTRAGRSRPGISVHHRLVDPRDARILDGVPCVSSDLVLIDLAQSLGEAELETVLVAAESLGLLKRHRLAELIAADGGSPGISKLRRILALEPAIMRSELEGLVLPICRLAGIERPRVNFPVSVPARPKPLIVDFAWPDLRLVFEADSQRFHGDWERATWDRERDQLLALAGWQCHRFVRGRLVGDREGSARRFSGLVRARRAEVS